jgi:hypothetical protein
MLRLKRVLGVERRRFDVKRGGMVELFIRNARCSRLSVLSGVVRFAETDAARFYGGGSFALYCSIEQRRQAITLENSKIHRILECQFTSLGEFRNCHSWDLWLSNF